MPAFTFEALDAEGHARRGTLQADTARAARGQLRQQGLVPLAVMPLDAEGKVPLATDDDAPTRRTSGWAQDWFTGRVFHSARLAVWTRQLASLVQAGLTLERSLAALIEDAENPRERNLMHSLRAEVSAGSSFAQALSQHPREFNAVMCSVVAAGEQSGALGGVLLRLADELDEREALASKLLGAALYPAIVSVVALVIVGFLLTWVVPQVAGVFAGGKRALPTLTVVMLNLSAWLKAAWPYLLIAIVLIAVSARILGANAAFVLKRDSALLRAPVLGRLTRTYHAARFARTLALLAASGVPILKALQTAADTVGNAALKTDAQDALAMVREGAPLGAALARGQRFPALLPLFARLGEQTGDLPAMLERCANQLSTDVQRRALRLATLAEPLLIVLMGALVMLIVLAVMLPIIELNQVVR
jgi:general secretion pathway protein F